MRCINAKKILVINAAVFVVFAFGCAPLHEAVYNGDLKKVRKIIENGEDIDKVCETTNSSSNCYGSTPLEIAIEKNQQDIARYLIAKGANIERRDRIRKETILMKAAFKGDKNSEIVRLLLSKGADINAKSTDGKTALMNTWCFDFDIVEILLRNGADVLAENLDKKTALDIFIEKNEEHRKEGWYDGVEICTKSISLLKDAKYWREKEKLKSLSACNDWAWL